MMAATKIQYKEVEYNDFVDAIHEAYVTYRKVNDKSEVEIAVCLNKSHMSVRNCFTKREQKVSDQILTHLMQCIGMEGKIEWRNGEKKYFIEK